MNEEISKILEMLEAGKIDAAEAEKLIRTINEAKKPEERARPICPNPFRDIEDLFRIFGKAARQAARRRSRWAVWRFYSFLHWQEEARRERARTMSTFERVSYVLKERALVDGSDIQPTTRFRPEGFPGAFYMDTLRVVLEYEFGIEMPIADLSALETVQDLVSYIDGRSGAAPPDSDDRGGAPVPEPPAPDAPKPKARAAKTGGND
jgi:acyl carrier protein